MKSRNRKRSVANATYGGAGKQHNIRPQNSLSVGILANRPNAGARIRIYANSRSRLCVADVWRNKLPGATHIENTNSEAMLPNAVVGNSSISGAFG